MCISKSERHKFIEQAKLDFKYLETNYDLSLKGVYDVSGDPRDSFIVVKYRNSCHRVDVSWSPALNGLGVLVRLDNQHSSRREYSIHAEPFIEFISNGEIKPIVPQIYPAMSVSRLQAVADARAKLFTGGVLILVRALSCRFKNYYDTIRDVSGDIAEDYHKWYRGVAGK